MEFLPKNVDVRLAWSVLLHDIGKFDTIFIHKDGSTTFQGHDSVGEKLSESICNRLKMSSDEKDCITFCVGMHMKIQNILDWRKYKQVQMMRHPYFDILMLVHKYDGIGGKVKNNAY